MRKIILAVSFLMLTGMNVIWADDSGQQQAAQQKIEQIEGRMASFDWVASTFVLKFLNGANYEEIEFYVPQDTPIIKLEGPIEFSDVELDDLLRVEFYQDKETGKNIVVRMEDVV